LTLFLIIKSILVFAIRFQLKRTSYFVFLFLFLGSIGQFAVVITGVVAAVVLCRQLHFLTNFGCFLFCPLNWPARVCPIPEVLAAVAAALPRPVSL